MFTQLFTVVSVAMLALAGAVPPQGQCNVGSVQCCDSVQSADSDAASQLLAIVGAVVQGAAVQVGITCSPITVIGLGAGSSCTAQPVCCENNNFNGVVAIGCTPINIGL